MYVSSMLRTNAHMEPASSSSKEDTRTAVVAAASVVSQSLVEGCQSFSSSEIPVNVAADAVSEPSAGRIPEDRQTPPLTQLPFTVKAAPRLSEALSNTAVVAPQQMPLSDEVLAFPALPGLVVPSSAPCVHDEDVLKDAEAYLWGGNLSSDQPKEASGSRWLPLHVVAHNDDGAGKEATVQTLPVVVMEPADRDASRLLDFTSEALAVPADNIPLTPTVKRCGSASIDGSDDYTTTLSSHPHAVAAAMGPVASFRVSVDGEMLHGSALRPSRAAPQILLYAPPLLAAEDVEATNTGPSNWREYSTAAAKLAASKATSGMKDVVASQVPGGSLAVSAVDKGAATLSAARSAAAAVSTSSFAASSSAANAAPLRSASQHLSSSVSASKQRRQQQLKLYVKQNFVPTFSDFVPGTNQLAERAAAAASRQWKSAREKRQRAAEAASPSPQDHDDAQVEMERDLCVGAAPETEEAACVVVAESLDDPPQTKRGETSRSAARSAAAAAAAACSKSMQPEKQKTSQTTPPSAAAAAAASEGEDAIPSTPAPSLVHGFVPYATIRVLLCRCDGGARNGNDPVDAFAKFTRMPCKRKAQELLTNFVYNLLPHTAQRSRSSPFTEVLHLTAQQTWSGTPPLKLAAQQDARVPVLSAVEEVQKMTKKKSGAVKAVNGNTSQFPAYTKERDVFEQHEKPQEKASFIAPDLPERCRRVANTDVPVFPSNALNPLSPAAVANADDDACSRTVPCVATQREQEQHESPEETLRASAVKTSLDGSCSDALDALSPLPSDSAFYAYQTYGQQTVLYNADYGAPQLHEWTRGIPCCCSAESCREGCCCMHCQLARQCNMLNYRRPTVLWSLCALVCLLDPCTCLLCSSTLACVNRATVRARYGIGGSFLEDCLFTLLCTRCATSQVMDEMIAHDEYPGGVCMLPPVPIPNLTAMK